jgi:hypothetical protein
MSADGYTYFVSYAFAQGDGWGFANCPITLGQPVTSYADVLCLAEGVNRRDTAASNATVIVSYQLLSGPAGGGL